VLQGQMIIQPSERARLSPAGVSHQNFPEARKFEGPIDAGRSTEHPKIHWNFTPTGKLLVPWSDTLGVRLSSKFVES
jgi:hypothetical protein